MSPGTIGWLSAGLSEVPNDDGWVDPGMAARFSGIRFTKRFTEARLARWVAKRTVAATLGLAETPESLRRIVIRNAPDGAPEAIVGEEPISAVIAMTDRADWSVCAILDGGGRVGCDLELVEPRSAAFVADYFTATEQRRIAAATDTRILANVMWSAKESALKVLRTGLRRDTRTVEVHLDDNDAPDWRPLHIEDTEGRSYPGWWVRFGEFVLTVATEGPTMAPVSLVEPPPLAAATPGHAWMHSMKLPNGASQET